MLYKLISGADFKAALSALFGNELGLAWQDCDDRDWGWCDQYGKCLEKIARPNTDAESVPHQEIVFDERLNSQGVQENADSFYRPLQTKIGIQLIDGSTVTFIFAESIDDAGWPVGSVLIGGLCQY